jgi:LacI family transcriptional regulator
VKDVPRNTTLKTVAEEAGVSISVVSKVLHGRGKNVRVGEETARHVRETAARLRYVPNGLARSLRMSRTNTVGLIFENFGQISAGPLFYVYLLDGVAQELFSRHFRLTILSEVDHERPLSSIEDGRLDGVIWCKLPGSEPSLDQLKQSSIPIVALNAPDHRVSLELVHVFCDNDGGAKLVVDHLVDLGHRRILFALERHEELTPDAQARLGGFLRAMQNVGLEVQADDVVVWSRDANEFNAWSAQTTDHTAIFAWNEGLGAAILDRAREQQIAVPSELSVVGFDSTRFCESTVPRLTAANQPIREMAAMAAQILLDQIEGKSPSIQDIRFACTLDVRDSTGPAFNRTQKTQR